EGQHQRYGLGVRMLVEAGGRLKLTHRMPALPHLRRRHDFNPQLPMATAKKTTKVTPPKTAPKASTPAKTAAAKPVTTLKPIKSAFNKTALNAHLAEHAGVEPKAVKAVLA